LKSHNNPAVIVIFRGCRESFFNFNAMNKIILSLGVMALAVTGFSSCKKAGRGGDATLVVAPKHHGTPITSTALYRDSVFVKFNAEDLPSDPTNNYDALFVGEPGETHVNCPGLKAGKYYIYATGRESSSGERVTGGVSVKIKYKERKDEIEVDVPVTE
jgi:hypothetical protein